MNVPPCIINQLKDWRALKEKGNSICYAIKSYEALIRFYRCKNKNRKKSHYKDYARFNCKSFDAAE